MHRYGDAVTPTRINSGRETNKEILEKISCLAGSPKAIQKMGNVPSKEPFAFWMREASIQRMKEERGFRDGLVHLRRGWRFTSPVECSGDFCV